MSEIAASSRIISVKIKVSGRGGRRVVTEKLNSCDSLSSSQELRNVQSVLGTFNH